jgi:hypothetical protein
VSVTATTDGPSRNALVRVYRGQGLAGGAWLDKHGWCERADALGYSGLLGHWHCEGCGLCLGVYGRGQRADARYCSNACRQRAYRQRKAD